MSVPALAGERGGTAGQRKRGAKRKRENERTREGEGDGDGE